MEAIPGHVPWLRECLAVCATFVIAVAGCDRRPSATDEHTTTAADVGPCRDGVEWYQRHGTSCVCCHKEFTVAGSVQPDAGVVSVLVTDRDGRELEIAPNPFANFFRHTKMTPPLRARIRFEDGEERVMEHAAPHGSCNACHGDLAPRLGQR